MSTLRQIEANRRNARKSTGPTSVTGKAVSSMNNLKTGLHAKSLVLPCESLADLEQLTEECYLHYHPANPEQRFYVDDLIRCEWTLRRLDNAETQTWQYQNHDIYVGGGEKGYQFGGREGARCGVTLWPAVGRRKREEADCFLSQVGVSSLLTSGVR